MPRLAEAFGQLPQLPLRQRWPTLAGGADDDCAVIVWSRDSVGSQIPDHPTGELPWPDLLGLPRIRVSEGEPASPGGPCQHEDRRSSVNGLPHRAHIQRIRTGQPRQLGETRDINGIADGVLLDGIQPQRQHPRSHARQQHQPRVRPAGGPWLHGDQPEPGRFMRDVALRQKHLPDIVHARTEPLGESVRELVAA